MMNSVHLQGAERNKSKFVVSHPEIESFEQGFYENVIIEDGRIRRYIRSRRQEIDSYEQYYSLLHGMLQRIKDNYEDEHRTVPLIPYTTISSGYDSTAVSCLVRGLGVQDCFTSPRSNSWMHWNEKYSRDDGTETANRLGYRVHYMEDRDIAEDEAIFWLQTAAEILAFHTKRDSPDWRNISRRRVRRRSYSRAIMGIRCGMLILS